MAAGDNLMRPHIVLLFSADLSLDATDISGEQHINIAHNIFKRRLDDHGSPIEQPKKDNSKCHNDDTN